jgi:hypothetical protein
MYLCEAKVLLPSAYFEAEVLRVDKALVEADSEKEAEAKFSAFINTKYKDDRTVYIKGVNVYPYIT